MNILRRIFHRKRAWIYGCSSPELKYIKEESDHLSAALNSTKGKLEPEDMERLKRLSGTLDVIIERENSR